MVVDYGNVLDTFYGFRVSAACNMVNLMDIKEIKSNNMSKETKADNIHASPAVLHLTLTKKWFYMIESGEKKEEYRDIKPFWNRIFSCYIRIKGKYYHPTDVIICFSNGYSKNRRHIILSPIKFIRVIQNILLYGTV